MPALHVRRERRRARAMSGAEPVLCDVRSAHDFNIDPEDVARRITPRTRAVVAVHFCGYPARGHLRCASCATSTGSS